MPKYATDYDWWIARSSRAGRKRGTLLANFDAAFKLHKTLANCNATDLTHLDALYAAWINSKGGTSTKLNTRREPEATQLRLKLVQACNGLGIVSACHMAAPLPIGNDDDEIEVIQEKPLRMIPVPQVKRRGGKPIDWVEAVRDELESFNEKNYAVLDAAGYSGDIAPGKQKAVLDKLEAFKGSKNWTLGDAVLPSSTDWDESVIRPVYERLIGKKERFGAPGHVGVCTSFGKAAAYILTNDRDTGPLVEMVSFKGRTGVAHIYVVVGREPIYEEGNKLPSSDQWGKDAVIVDPWLCAMGWGAIFTVADHPKKGYLNNVTARMVREAR